MKAEIPLSVQFGSDSNHSNQSLTQYWIQKWSILNYIQVTVLIDEHLFTG